MPRNEPPIGARRLISDLVETRHQLSIDRDVKTLDDTGASAYFFRGGNLRIREAINRHSAISTVVVICVLILGLVVIALELKGQSGKPPKDNYYTTDDGKTWFVDSASKLPPFDHDGVPAVRCYVFKGGNGEFVGLLEKYTDATRDQLARAADHVQHSQVPVLVKRPGEKDWMTVGPDQEATIIMHISAPDGSEAERVIP
ncbi:MAG: hypothetical protein ABSH08_00885 [Tepidisphaeraceae bacterium]|jgi:hypothetical protein